MYTTIGTFTNECVIITYAIKVNYNLIIVHKNMRKKYLTFSSWVKAIIQN